MVGHGLTASDGRRRAVSGPQLPDGLPAARREDGGLGRDRVEPPPPDVPDDPPHHPPPVGQQPGHQRVLHHPDVPAPDQPLHQGPLHPEAPAHRAQAPRVGLTRPPEEGERSVGAPHEGPLPVALYLDDALAGVAREDVHEILIGDPSTGPYHILPEGLGAVLRMEGRLIGAPRREGDPRPAQGAVVYQEDVAAPLSGLVGGHAAGAAPAYDQHIGVDEVESHLEPVLGMRRDDLSLAHDHPVAGGRSTSPWNPMKKLRRSSRDPANRIAVTETKTVSQASGRWALRGSSASRAASV